METVLVYALVPLFFFLAVLFVVIVLPHYPSPDLASSMAPASSRTTQPSSAQDQAFAYVLLALLLLGFCVLALVNQRHQEKK